MNEFDRQMKKDSAEGTVLGIIIGIIIIAFIILYFMAILIAGLGAIIGGFYSIKNHVLSFKHNVVDSNRNLKSV